MCRIDLVRRGGESASDELRKIIASLEDQVGQERAEAVRVQRHDRKGVRRLGEKAEEIATVDVAQLHGDVLAARFLGDRSVDPVCNRHLGERPGTAVIIARYRIGPQDSRLRQLPQVQREREFAHREVAESQIPDLPSHIVDLDEMDVDILDARLLVARRGIDLGTKNPKLLAQHILLIGLDDGGAGLTRGVEIDDRVSGEREWNHMLVGELIGAAAIYATPRRRHLLNLVLAHVDFGQFHRHEVAQAALIMKRAVAHQVLNRRCLLS
ncbi:MAG: hypothetical protein EOR19_32915 [Mesorhizobium sp.]|nr:MAG: hypothetical protein EOR19_32915 [Mesorhizobium sp.]